MKEEDTGRIPLPAVESIVWTEGRRPSLSVIAPDVLPGCQVVFVDTDAMPLADRLRLVGSLRLLEDLIQRLAGQSSRVTAI